MDKLGGVDVISVSIVLPLTATDTNALSLACA